MKPEALKFFFIQRLEYKFPSKSPIHLAAPGLHPKYDYETFIGGIFLISRKQFKVEMDNKKIMRTLLRIGAYAGIEKGDSLARRGARNIFFASLSEMASIPPPPFSPPPRPYCTALNMHFLHFHCFLTYWILFLLFVSYINTYLGNSDQFTGNFVVIAAVVGFIFLLAK